MKQTVNGYKSFNKNFETFNNIKMKENQIYKIDDDIKYSKVGYHFATRLEDTLRYVNGLKEEIIICNIEALGNIDWHDDEYYGYYDLGCTNIIKINNILTREEIIKYIYNKPEFNIIRFISGYKLTNEELKLFKERYKNNNNILNYIKYYQENDTQVFDRNHKKLTKKYK